MHLELRALMCNSKSTTRVVVGVNVSKAIEVVTNLSSGINDFSSVFLALELDRTREGILNGRII